MGAAEGPGRSLEDGGGRRKTDASQASFWGRGCRPGVSAHQKPSWGGEGAGARGRGEPQVLEDGLSSGGAKDDGDDAAGAPLRGQARTSVWNVRLRGSAQGMGRRGRGG
jgi:hypothetical protein